MSTFLAIAGWLARLVAPIAKSTAPRNDLAQPYRTMRDWGQLPAGLKWAAVTAIEPAPDGTIDVVHRCFANSCASRNEPPILEFDANGKLLAQWGEGMFFTDARGENGKGRPTSWSRQAVHCLSPKAIAMARTIAS
jgi:hypothetical protein